MSDNETAAVDEPKRKRGRPAKGASEVKDTKKRGRSAVDDKKEVKKADGASPAKRGRGRPKGSTKKRGAKAAPKKAAGGGGRGRGRPKKDDKKVEESAEDEEEEEEEEEEGED